jgi:hypothetical protein
LELFAPHAAAAASPASAAAAVAAAASTSNNAVSGSTEGLDSLRPEEHWTQKQLELDGVFMEHACVTSLAFVALTRTVYEAYAAAIPIPSLVPPTSPVTPTRPKDVP